VQYLNC